MIRNIAIFVVAFMVAATGQARMLFAPIGGGTPPPSPTITINGSSGPVTVSPGATITAAVTGGPGNPSDWVAMYTSAEIPPLGATGIRDWKYISNNSQTEPSSGVTSGSVTLLVPTGTGTYIAYFLLNDGFVILATSALITAE